MIRGMTDKPTPLSGFPELLPEQRAVERAGDRQRCARTFELHGFANIETRAVEPLDRLLPRAARSTRRSTSCAACRPTTRPGDSGLGLHFDLTVPFARYVLENAGKLEFPFRRYQIQPAWRGERPQEGRYRQFTQADIDIVGRDELPFHHDVEVVRVMVEALDALPLPPLSFQVNNRKLIQGFYRGLGIPDVTAAIRVDRQARQAAGRGGRGAAGRPRPAPRRSRRSAASSSRRSGSPDTSFVERGPGARRRATSCSTRGWPSWRRSSTAARAVVSDRVTVEANLRIARGLDYYTGTVFEIFMAGYERLKSVGGGGRYDALASDGRTTYPGVGISLRRLPHPGPADRRRRARAASREGAERRAGRPRRRGVRAASDAVAAALRARGIPCEVAASAAEVRQADPVRRAPRASPTSGSPGRRQPRGQGHPLRRAGRRRSGHLDPAEQTCDRRLDRHEETDQ